MAYEDFTVPAGTKVVFKADAGQAGTDTADFFVLTTDFKDSELQDEAWAFGKNHAEMYGIYPASEYSDEDIEEDPESYSENIEGWYEIYDPEEHDGLRTTGYNGWTEL